MEKTKKVQRYKRNMSVEEKTKLFIEDAQKIHGDKYDYSKAQYLGDKKETTIICPIHGEFNMKTYVHIKLGCGCPKCGKDKVNSMHEEKRDKCKQTIFDRANSIHNNKYDYSKFDYKNINTESVIICPVHGEFSKNMNKHIYRKQGCPKCSKENNKSILERTVEDILLENNISYIYNYQITTDEYLKNKPFDFYLPDYNLLIEVQGTQHYTKKFNMTDKDLEERIQIDKMKKEKSEELGYNYLEIDGRINIEKFKPMIMEEVQRLLSKTDVD